jgi:hypothetical protein
LIVIKADRPRQLTILENKGELAMSNLRETRESIGERLKRWYAATADAIGEAKLLAGLDEESVKLLAQDCAITPQELRDLIRKGPHASDELLALMDAIGIDKREAQLLEPDQLREMHVTCAYCGERSRCRAALADGSAHTEFGYYCGNTELLLDMWSKPEFRSK